MIFNGDAVSKHELRLQRIAVIRLVERFYTHLNAFGDHAGHNSISVKIKKNNEE
jgi:hypothetical protein